MAARLDRRELAIYLDQRVKPEPAARAKLAAALDRGDGLCMYELAGEVTTPVVLSFGSAAADQKQAGPAPFVVDEHGRQLVLVGTYRKPVEGDADWEREG